MYTHLHACVVATYVCVVLLYRVYACTIAHAHTTHTHITQHTQVHQRVHTYTQKHIYRTVHNYVLVDL